MFQGTKNALFDNIHAVLWLTIQYLWLTMTSYGGERYKSYSEGPRILELELLLEVKITAARRGDNWFSISDSGRVLSH